MVLQFGENFIILTSTVFLCSSRLTDRETGGRMDGWTGDSIYILAIAYMLSRVKIK